MNQSEHILEMLKRGPAGPDEISNARNQARAAIAKATGVTQ
jgi:hypothetical protein